MPRVDIVARRRTTTGKVSRAAATLLVVCVNGLVHQAAAFETVRVRAAAVDAAPARVAHDGVVVDVQVLAVASVAVPDADDAAGHGERVGAFGAVMVDFDGHQQGGRVGLFDRGGGGDGREGHESRDDGALHD